MHDASPSPLVDAWNGSTSTLVSLISPAGVRVASLDHSCMGGH